ncbi:MAG: folate family ECF transporter S component [Clostridia bacterium]|nr:folate family ECF transporter S component [Clostridia bacterium]
MNSNRMFSNPFSKEYWHQAMADFKNLRILVFAALMIALRIVLKPVGIPIAADLRINAGFFVNAYGAMVFGPVVAIFAAAITDTLGFLVYPNGIYFLPFMLTEIAGSLIFALFLYRTEVSTTRIILSRFCIDLFVNVLLNAPIMALYYTMVMGRSYVLFDLLRIIKNLAMFPIESLLLIIFFRLVIPPTRKIGYIVSGTEKLRFTKKTGIIMGLLLVCSISLTAFYAIHTYNTTSFSASYTAEERLTRNTEMTEWARQEGPYGDELVVIIESARSRVGAKEMTYELALYRLDRDVLAGETDLSEETVRGYSKSKAAKEPSLTRIGSAIALTDKKSGEHLSMTITPDERAAGGA